jgi:group I intron endonuclease
MKTDKSYGVVYLITNKRNGKCYIGQTTNFSKRIKKYKRLECKGQQRLYNSLAKHGVENFSFEIIDEAIDKIQLDFLEIFYIEKFRSTESDHGYNLRSGGSFGKHSKESNLKNSEAHKGITITEEAKRKISIANSGKKRTDEQIKFLSELRKGIKQTEEHIKKSADSRRGGKRSEESKKRMSEAQKGKIISEETKQKMSIVKLGKTQSEDTKKKISQSNKGRRQTEETKQKKRKAWEIRKLKGITEETRERMREAQRKAKTWTGRKHSIETKEKMSDSAKERKRLKELQLTT